MVSPPITSRVVSSDSVASELMPKSITFPSQEDEYSGLSNDSESEDGSVNSSRISWSDMGGLGDSPPRQRHFAKRKLFDETARHPQEIVAEVSDYSVLSKDEKMMVLRPVLSNPNQHSKEAERIAKGKSDSRTSNSDVIEAITAGDEVREQIKLLALQAVINAADKAEIDLKQATKIILLAREMEGLTATEEKKRDLPILLEKFGESNSREMKFKVINFSKYFQKNMEQVKFFTARQITNPEEYGMRLKTLTEFDAFEVLSHYLWTQKASKNMGGTIPIIDKEAASEEFGQMKDLAEKIAQEYKSQKPSLKASLRAESPVTKFSSGHGFVRK